MLFVGILRSEVPIEAPTNYKNMGEDTNKDNMIVKPYILEVAIFTQLPKVLSICVVSHLQQVEFIKLS